MKPTSLHLLQIKTESNTLAQDFTVFIIKDIYENGYCFTDGCGLISLGLAEKVAENIGLQIKHPVRIANEINTERQE